MLVLVKYEDGTLRSIDSTDVKEVSNPTRGVTIRIANDDYIFVKANDQEKECIELHTIFVSNHLNLTNYGVVDTEEYKPAEEREAPELSLKDYVLQWFPYFILVAGIMYLILSRSLVEVIKAISEYTYEWMYPIFGDTSGWVFLGVACVFAVAIGYIVYRTNEKKQK